MRKFLRNMARTKMKEMGYNKVNRRMHSNWRKIIGAYPTNLINGEKMPKSFRGNKRNQKGSYSAIYSSSFVYVR